MNWIAPRYLTEANRKLLGPLDLGIYDGRLGVALFLSAFGMVSGDSMARSVALRACRGVNRHTNLDQLINPRGLGAANGLGSIVYALASIARMSEAPALLESALGVAERIKEIPIEEDTALDVMGGSAGALLSLLTLYEQTKHVPLLEMACRMGDHLVSSQTEDDRGRGFWFTQGGHRYSGFSHGSCGIGHALLRLFEATREADYRAAAIKSISFESSLFDANACNWHIEDLAEESGNGEVCDANDFSVSWCYGAPGIVISRARMAHLLGVENVADEITRAVTAIGQSDWGKLDHLCCGSFGRVEAMFVAGHLLHEPGWVDDARAASQMLLEKYRQRGGFENLENVPSEVPTPWLFQGNSGIAYQLLRMEFPEEVRCLLLWE